MHQVLKHAYENFIAELQGVDTALAQIHPDGNEHRWTTHQVVEHLILSLRLMGQQLQERIEKGRLPSRTRRTRADWLMQLMVLSLGHMPSGIPAMLGTEPDGALAGLSGRELAQRLRAELAAADEVLEAARQRFGLERVGHHFLLGPLRVDQWRRYHVVHLRRHAAQVRGIRRSFAVEAVHAPRAVVQA